MRCGVDVTFGCSSYLTFPKLVRCLIPLQCSPCRVIRHDPIPGFTRLLINR